MGLNAAPVNTAPVDGQFRNLVSNTSAISGAATVVSAALASATVAQTTSGTSTLSLLGASIHPETISCAGTGVLSDSNVASAAGNQAYALSGTVASSTTAIVDISQSLIGSATLISVGQMVVNSAESFALSAALSLAHTVQAVVESDVTGSVVLVTQAQTSVDITDIALTRIATIDASNARIVLEQIFFAETVFIVQANTSSASCAGSLAGTSAFGLSPGDIYPPLITLPSSAGLSPVDNFVDALAIFAYAASATLDISQMTVDAVISSSLSGSATVAVVSPATARNALGLHGTGALSDDSSVVAKGTSTVSGAATVSSTLLANALVFSRTIGNATVTSTGAGLADTTLTVTGTVRLVDNGQTNIVESMLYPASAGLSDNSSVVGKGTLVASALGSLTTSDEASAIVTPTIKGAANISDSAISSANDIATVIGTAALSDKSVALVNQAQTLSGTVTLSVAAMARATEQLAAIISAQLSANAGNSIFVSLDIQGGAAVQVESTAMTDGSLSLPGTSNIWTTYGQVVSVTAGLSAAAELLVVSQALADAGVPIETVAEIVADTTTLPFSLMLPDYGGTIVILGSTSWPTQGPLVPE